MGGSGFDTSADKAHILTRQFVNNTRYDNIGCRCHSLSLGGLTLQLPRYWAKLAGRIGVGTRTRSVSKYNRGPTVKLSFSFDC